MDYHSVEQTMKILFIAQFFFFKFCREIIRHGKGSSILGGQVGGGVMTDFSNEGVWGQLLFDVLQNYVSAKLRLI